VFNNNDLKILEIALDKAQYSQETKLFYIESFGSFLQDLGLTNLVQITNLDVYKVEEYFKSKEISRHSGLGRVLVLLLQRVEKILFEKGIINENKIDFQKATRRKTLFSGSNIVSKEIFQKALSEFGIKQRNYLREWEHVEEIERRNLIITILIYTCGLQSTEISGARWAQIKKIDGKFYLKTKRDHESKFFYYEIIPYLYEELLKYKKNLDKIGVFSPFLVCSFGRRSKSNALTTKAIKEAVKSFFKIIERDITPVQVRNFSQFCIQNNVKLSDDLYVGNHFVRYQCKSCDKESELIINNICEECKNKSSSKTSKNIVGYVYFIITENHNYIKIGITKKSVERRLSNIQSGNMYKLKILGYLPSDNPKKLEKKLHKHFLKFRMEGEWFNIPESKLYEVLAQLNLSKDLQKFS